MKKVFTPWVIILTTALFFVVFLEACKKDKDEPIPEGSVGIQVVVPAGASIDLSKTSVYSLSKSFGVGSDGKSIIAFNKGSYEVVFLYDENNKPIMAGIISDENKEISITTTAQALLYYGLGVMYSRSNEERIAYIKKIPTYPQFAEFKSQLEQLFVANPIMLSTDAYKEAYIKAVSEINNKPILDLIGKQIQVQDADEAKSGLTVRAQSGSDENMEVVNTYARRGHAYMYKVAYRDNTNYPYTLLSEILNITPSDYDMAVRGREGTAPEVSGPQSLPLENYESESTWKVRVVGIGGNESDIEMTNVEKIKYEEMCIEFFAVDLLMPLILDNLDQSKVIYDVLPNNIERVRAYINEVKTLVRPETINEVRDGDYTEAVRDFCDYALWDSQKREQLYKKLLECISDIVPAQELQALSDLEGNDERQQAFVDVVRGGLFTWLINANTNDNSSPIDARFTHISNSSTLDEWTVISKNNDVTITPKHSQTMKLVNYTLTASATASLGTGERIEYVWTTPGAFGVFKQGGVEVTTTTSSSTATVTYYGKIAPDENNIETVYVKASITGPNGTRELGTDTAYVNVKNLLIVMEPNGATVTPIHGRKSIRLYLQNADGTNPIIQGNGVQYKVEWSTGGAYGSFNGDVTQFTGSTNSVVYNATDEEVKIGTENITATVYFKLSSTGWMLRQVVKGTVKVENDMKKIIYYTAPRAYYYGGSNDNYHASACGVYVRKEPYAISYAVQVTNITNVNPMYNPYSDSWQATTTDHVRGYMGYVLDEAEAGEDFITGITGTASWGSGISTDRGKSCTGTAKVTVLVSQ